MIANKSIGEKVLGSDQSLSTLIFYVLNESDIEYIG